MKSVLESMESENLNPSLVAPSVPERMSLLDRVVAFDLAFLKSVTAWSLPKYVSWPLVLLVRTGDGWIWFLITFYLWRTLPLLQLQSVVFHCLLTLAISLVLYWPIKLLVRRKRPHDSDLGITPSVPPLDKFSFPSGHTMNNLAVALTVSIYRPQLFIPALLLPIALGMLRILFWVHYFSDIAGGTLLGVASYFLGQAIFPLLPL